jgi:hypothetical protein
MTVAATEWRMKAEASRSALAVACALLAVTGVGEAQSGVEPDLRIELAERIREAQAEGGSYSKELIDPLRSLSVTYEEDGNHASALAVLDQALQVTRANYGLSALEQAPLLRQMIRSEQRRGNAAGVWELEHDLLTLAAQNSAGLRTVPILHEIGDKRMDLLGRYLDGEKPPELVLGCYYANPRGRGPDNANAWRKCDAGQRSVAARNMLFDAQRTYADAISVFLRQQLYASEELYELEAKLLRNSYLYGGYAQGEQSLRRLIGYDVANGASPTTRILNLVHLADWALLFDRRPAALERYAEIYSLLEEHGVPRSEIDRVFASTTPVPLPVFEPNPYAKAENARGHVDVEFEITRFGTTRRVDVAGKSNVSAQDVGRLLRWIVRSHFRPTIADGEARDSRIAVRYYVHE